MGKTSTRTARASRVKRTQLRLELWDRDRLSRDDFIGEVYVRLCPLMDARVHEYELPLVDPEGKCGADGGVQICFGELFEAYAHISDTLVGILMRARKRGGGLAYTELLLTQGPLWVR